MSLVSTLLFVVASFTTSNATEVNLGGFTGNVSTIVTHGFSIRTEKNNCFLVYGAANDQTDAQKALIGGAPYKGNGGCNYERDDNFAATTTGREIHVGSVMGDDGRLNFDRGDVIDAGQSLALSFTGSNPDGVRLNLSGVALVNPVLDINDVAFKALTGAAKDHLESNIKLGNAFISAPVSPNIDITLGNYVQSQGVTALFPIGVNVVNPVSLPILRSPGAQLKDALLPQAMLGATAYLDGGVTMDAYYQLEQKEIELDAAGSFFGSEAVGVGSNTGFISAANVNEGTGPVDGNYFDVAECVKGVSRVNLAAVGSAGLCDSSNADHLWGDNEDGWSVFMGLQDDTFGTGYNSTAVGIGLANQVTALGDIESIFEGVAAGASLQSAWDLLPGHASSADTDHDMSDTRIRNAFTKLYTQYPGFGDMRGLVYIRRANDAEAPSTGQFGLNLTGYLDNVGTGLEWGLYYNNSHSNAPRLRMLAIADGYATDMFAMLNNLTTAAPAGLGQYDPTNGAVTVTEQAIMSIAAGPSVCALINNATGAFQGGAAGGTATHLHDPSLCYKAQAQATAAGGAIAAAGGLDAILGATNGAIATLAFVNGGRFQAYYPEDIQTFGLSLSTGLSGWASNLEIAFRPDYPFQVAGDDLIRNLIDSTYGTAVQSTVAAIAVNDLLPLVASTKWSAQPNCDITSTGGKAAPNAAGYVACDGTAEFDAWTLNANFAKSYTASEPFVVNSGADSAFVLVDIGAVSVPDLNYAQGVVASGQFQSGFDVLQNGCNNAAGAYALSQQSNGLFGDDYCEDDAGPDKNAISYKLRGGLTYNNFNNTKWSFSPSFGFNHDVKGNAPSSLGGFVEGRMSASASAAFTSGGMTTSVSYQMELGDELNNSSVDKDYVSANFSYAF